METEIVTEMEREVEMEMEIEMEMEMQTRRHLIAIDVTTQITERETDGGQKFGYYAAILSAKKGRGLRSLVPSRK